MFWSIYAGVLVFLFGTLMGSFYNVCIYRIPNSMSVVKPPSHCENCSHPLAPLDLIPILSWVLLGRKCRYCKAPLSVRYPLIELLTGVLFVLLFIKFRLSWQFLLYLAFISILIMVAFIDIDHRYIPDRFVLIGLALGAGSLFIPMISWQDSLFGGLIGGGSLLLMDLSGRLVFKKEGMGFGDVKLMGMAGLFLGVQRTIVSLLAAVWVAAVVGIVILHRRKEGKEETDHYMPFGPFLAAGCALSIFFGKELVRWYLSLL